MFQPSKLIIHCSDSEWGDVHIIDDWHRARGWDGIGYHFVILNGAISAGINQRENSRGRDGMLQFGRPLNKQGAHCRRHNATSIGICLIGKGDDFTDAQMKTLKFLCQSLVVQYSIKSMDIHPHSAFSNKTCPRFDVYKWVNDWDKPEQHTPEKRLREVEYIVSTLKDRVQQLEENR